MSEKYSASTMERVTNKSIMIPKLRTLETSLKKAEAMLQNVAVRMKKVVLRKQQLVRQSKQRGFHCANDFQKLEYQIKLIGLSINAIKSNSLENKGKMHCGNENEDERENKIFPSPENVIVKFEKEDGYNSDDTLFIPIITKKAKKKIKLESNKQIKTNKKENRPKNPKSSKKVAMIDKSMPKRKFSVKNKWAYIADTEESENETLEETMEASVYGRDQDENYDGDST